MLKKRDGWFSQSVLLACSPLLAFELGKVKEKPQIPAGRVESVRVSEVTRRICWFLTERPDRLVAEDLIDGFYDDNRAGNCVLGADTVSMARYVPDTRFVPP